MQILLTLLIAFSVVLSAVVFLKLRDTSHQIEILSAMVRAGGPKTLVRSIDNVGKGMRKNDVVRLIGPADNFTGNEWVYYLDSYSGYLVKFDSAERVESVQSWQS